MQSTPPKTSAKPGPILFRLMLFTLAGLLVTGGAWLVLNTFFRSETEFGLINHPLQALLLQLHGFLVIIVSVSLGGVVFAHVPGGWGSKRKRISGVVLLGLFALLALTGYVLYYTGNLDLRAAASIAHWTIGLAVPFALLWHMAVRLRAR